MCVLEKFNPLIATFLWLSTTRAALFRGKIRPFTTQNNRFCSPKVVVLLCKPTAFAQQNDRNCHAKRPLLHCRALRFVAHFLYQRRQHVIYQSVIAAHSYVKKNRPRNCFFVFRALLEGKYNLSFEF